MKAPQRRVNAIDRILSSRLRRLRIRTRFAMIVTLLVGGIALFIWLYFPARQDWQGRVAIDGKALSIAEMTAFSVGPALLSDDPRTVARALEAAKQNRDLAFLAVLDQGGRVVASHNLSPAASAMVVRVRNGEHVSTDGETYALTTPVWFEGRKVGDVCVGLSLENLHAETSRSRAAIAVISIVIVVVGMMFVLAVSTVITDPLKRMVDSAQRIGKGDLTLRVTDSSRDEVGLLARTFNFMLDTLDESRRQVAEANRELEERVEQRTRELKKEINQRIKIEGVLRQQIAAIETSVDGMAILDTDGSYVFLNRAFARLYGYEDPDKLFGQSWRLQYDDEERAWLEREIMPSVARNSQWRGETTGMRRDGSRFPQQLSLSSVPGGGMVFVVHDISDRKKAEAEEEKRRVLEMQLAQAQKIESIGTLAGGIAHDFNNILAIILGHAGILELGGGKSPAVSRSVQAITTAVQRGAGIVRQILTFARKAETTVEPLNVNGIVRELVKMLVATFPKSISLVQHLTESDPVIRADRNQLHQTLLNLCVNARDAMPGGGTVTLNTDVVDDTLLRRKHPDAPAGTYVRLSVTDTGSGMDPTTVERIFEPFFTTKEKGKGTGLGLAVAYGIVKSHHGYIDVVSAPGSGTTFDIHLPLERQEKKTPGSEAPKEAPTRGTETILVAEDEEMLLVYLESVLESYGYTVLAARDGQAALDLFHTHKEGIALVMTDLDMPRINGRQLIAKVLEVKPGCRTILASGFIEPHLRDELVRSGIRHVISKPYAPADLMGKIREALA